MQYALLLYRGCLQAETGTLLFFISPTYVIHNFNHPMNISYLHG